ncbi:histidine kinase [Hamadaea sp. NPDC050747]|uniref:sensor histidine kinase n=1 Tax=Hamadaea sp. NPDC050747 TaxID=3155789 RepID=UPI0033D7B9FF
MAETEDELTERIKSALRPSGPVWRMTLRNQLFDIALALLCAFGGLDYVFDKAGDETIVPLPGPDGPVFVHRDGPNLGGLIFVTLLACVLISQRRRFPLAVLWAVGALTIPVIDDIPRVCYYGCVIAAYAAAAYSRYRLPTLVSVGVLALLTWRSTSNGMPSVPDQYVGIVVLAMLVLAGLALRLWRAQNTENARKLAAADEERATALRRAVESERSRIARELHDVVTHNVSVMVIQAGAARRTLDISPEQSRQALLAVEGAGRTAMAELRHVMGLLAPASGMPSSGPSSSLPARAFGPGEEAPDLAPQPGLDQLETLVGRVRDTGMPVALSVTGTPRAVASGEALAAYRVVQEALTNAVKHASGGAATVSVHYGEEELGIEVTDTGGRSTGDGGSGRGLLGLRERLAVYGGTLRTGPLITGDGWRVTAVIPLGTP